MFIYDAIHFACVRPTFCPPLNHWFTILTELGSEKAAPLKHKNSASLNLNCGSTEHAITPASRDLPHL